MLSAKSARPGNEGSCSQEYLDNYPEKKKKARERERGWVVEDNSG